MKSILKFLGIHCHEWTRWQQVEKIKLFEDNVACSGELSIGFTIVQKRTCETCGEVVYKTSRHFN